MKNNFFYGLLCKIVDVFVLITVVLSCLLACVQGNKNLVSVAFETEITVNFMLCSSARNVAKLTLWIYVKI